MYICSSTIANFFSTRKPACFLRASIRYKSAFRTLNARSLQSHLLVLRASLLKIEVLYVSKSPHEMFSCVVFLFARLWKKGKRAVQLYTCIYMYIQYVIRKFFKENWLGKVHRSILRNLRSSLIVVHFFSPPPIIDFHWNFLLRPNKFPIAMYIFWDSIQIFNNNKKKRKELENPRETSPFFPLPFLHPSHLHSNSRSNRGRGILNVKIGENRFHVCIDPISY